MKCSLRESFLSRFLIKCVLRFSECCPIRKDLPLHPTMAVRKHCQTESHHHFHPLYG